MTATVIDRDRLKLVKGLKLTTGSHTPPPPGKAPCGACVMELWAFVTGQEWTDDPKNCSRVISAMLRRANDVTDQAGRDMLGEWVFANADRLAATASDGLDEQRGWIAADWAIRHALPVWLDIAGAKDAARTLRGLKPVTDRLSARAAQDAAREAGRALPDWYQARQRLRKRVREAVQEALKNKPVDAAAAAAAAAAAVADVDADAAAAADVDVDAFAAAFAAAAADADAAVDAAAFAAADAAAAAFAAAAVDAAAFAAADAAAAAAGTWGAVYKAVRERLAGVYEAKLVEAGAPSFKESMVDVLERMVSVERAA